jgi:hypothetical protein
MNAPRIDRRTPIDQLPQFLTIDELAAYASIGRTAAYEFARLHGVRFGRLLRVPRDALAALRNGKDPGVNEPAAERPAARTRRHPLRTS